MKGGGGGGGKRRWKGLVIGVLVLVILSMLVPLAFLLGLHNGFHSSGFVTLQPSSASNDGFRQFDSFGRTNDSKVSKSESDHVDEVLRKLVPVLPKVPKDVEKIKGLGDINESSTEEDARRGLPVPSNVVPSPVSTSNTIDGAPTKEIQHTMVNADETGKACQVKYGSYCLWREENKEPMKDTNVKKMKDQLFVARAYYPSIAKMPSQSKLTRDMKQNIQDFERILSEGSADTDLPPQIDKKLQKMEDVISKAKSFPVDCNNVDKKLRQILDLTDDEVSFHMKQSVFLYQLAVQTMPKSLHCLSMRLTVEYFKSPLPDVDLSIAKKSTDPSLYHYVIISNNVLASSVVINSTVSHARDSKNLVFHVLTDEQNYFGMKEWFFRNPCKVASVQVLNTEKLDLENHDLHLSLPVEFRVSFRHSTHYLTIFSHSHYLLPKIFPNLEKVVVLDDDVVVQRDLSPLWDLDLEGKVNGAVRTCSLRLGQLKSHIGGGSFDDNACPWMSGLNIIDLGKWREFGVSETYQRLVKEMNARDKSSETISLRASLLTFQDLVYPLDNTWALSGLGYDHSVSAQAIKDAAILHYNGNMKPWLELGIPKYKPYWKKFLNRKDQFLTDCNVNP
ncbi:PREDICTED: probable galacturonosyltransferase 7 isoform X2 [Tarenaya hassleriana]|uniref:probable galacturonosyltransferase 7 isoform X2 n=1 Tax=Tarenaya hassleriana TaxID=28532 RepID=UPI00053C2833|nr:PREDICTED: probable galacturonosyltransferase 7 isoform X2 [Tarenaya hassleriana]